MHGWRLSCVPVVYFMRCWGWYCIALYCRLKELEDCMDRKFNGEKFEDLEYDQVQ